jgi:hypothetical protein
MLGISGGVRVVGVACVALAVTGCAPLACALCAALAIGPTPPPESDPISAELTAKCHDAVLKAAEPYGLVRAAFSSLGAIRPSHDGVVAPIFVTAVYLRRGSEEKRQALIECRLDDAGNVIALIAPHSPSDRAPARVATRQ